MNKLCVVALLALIGVACGASIRDWEGRIVGGSTAAINQFPFQASCRTATNGHFCGGWVHNNRYVISAAHCTIGRNTANTRVVVGAHSRTTGGTTHTTSRVVNHPNYNGNTLANDISFIQTAGAMTFNAAVQPISIGGTAIVGGNLAAVVSGWGQTAHPGSAAANLQFINTRTLTNADCQARHTANNRPFVHANTICTLATAANQGVCMGDSGGPVTVGNAVVGAVSWVIACARGFPDVHARVSSHRTWLLNNMV